MSLNVNLSPAVSTAPKPFVFVLMPFQQNFNDIYKFGIKGAAEDVGAYAERVDEQLFTEGILDRVYNQINKADVIVADMTGQNANVFYEVGYAHALNKVVILLTQNSDDIPFDLKHRPHIVYGGQIEVLRQQLSRSLEWAITESIKRGKGSSTKGLEISINDSVIPEHCTVDNATILSPTIKDRVFALPVLVRNVSSVESKGHEYIYLFTLPGSAFAPQKIVGFTTKKSIVGPIRRPQVEPLTCFRASAVDAVDGLNEQYRLDTKLGWLPPGAIESFDLTLKFRGFKAGEEEVVEPLRLRIFSPHNYQDFLFKLRAAIRSEQSKDEASETGERGGEEKWA